MKQEYYLIRSYYIDLNKSESITAIDVLVLLKDENGIIHKSTTIKEINGSTLEKMIGENYQQIVK